jgi:FdrA protein
MGPGAGTAVLGGTGLGFANEVVRGPVGVVAAAGTGAQEVSALLSRWGVGVSQVIGVGGRDLGSTVRGLMTTAALRTLDADPATEVVLIVSKPPDPEVAEALLAARGSRPTVATFLGVPAAQDLPEGVTFARTLEEGALLAAGRLGAAAPDLTGGLRERVAELAGGLDPRRTTVRGFFSGGTLCYEAQLIIGELLGNVWSNEPLIPGHLVPAPDGAHVLLDLGAEEYTDGRPHPMIDPGARIEVLRRDACRADVAVVLLDVVLGHGSHPDPAGELLPVLTDVMADGGPAVVAYVLGSEQDPQGYRDQRDKLEAIGCLVPGTAARAAYAAAALAARRPELALERG